MCNRPIAWREDPAVSGGNGGSHNLVPVMCDEYVKALEDALMGDTGVRSWPDSSVVNGIRKSLGLKELATPAASSAPRPPVYCSTCMGRSRETVGLVCQSCGRDYSRARATQFALDVINKAIDSAVKPRGKRA